MTTIGRCFVSGLAPLVTGCESTPCPLCQDFVDPNGDHLVSCRKNGITDRHNTVRDAFFDICVQGRIPAHREQGCEGQSRDADVLLLSWNAGRHLAVDFVVEHPLAPGRWPLNLGRVQQSVSEAEATKVPAAEARCARHSWDFLGAGFSPWGGSGPAATTILFELTKRVTHGLPGRRKSERASEVRQNFSLALARVVACQLRLAVRVMDHTPGQAQSQ